MFSSSVLPQMSILTRVSELQLLSGSIIEKYRLRHICTSHFIGRLVLCRDIIRLWCIGVQCLCTYQKITAIFFSQINPSCKSLNSIYFFNFSISIEEFTTSFLYVNLVAMGPVHLSPVTWPQALRYWYSLTPLMHIVTQLRPIDLHNFLGQIPESSQFLGASKLPLLE